MAAFPAAEDIQWQLPSDYIKKQNEFRAVEDQKNPNKATFCKNDFSSNEVKQGGVGNCWFISALSVLASYDELIRGGGDSCNTDPEHIDILDKRDCQYLSKGVFPPIFHRFAAYGIYCLRFFKNYSWRYVIIDEYLPTKVDSSDLIFA